MVKEFINPTPFYTFSPTALFKGVLEAKPLRAGGWEAKHTLKTGQDLPLFSFTS
jgi:hypothetical protein